MTYDIDDYFISSSSHLVLCTGPDVHDKDGYHVPGFIMRTADGDVHTDFWTWSPEFNRAVPGLMNELYNKSGSSSGSSSGSISGSTSGSKSSKSFKSSKSSSMPETAAPRWMLGLHKHRTKLTHTARKEHLMFPHIKHPKPLEIAAAAACIDVDVSAGTWARAHLFDSLPNPPSVVRTNSHDVILSTPPSTMVVFPREQCSRDRAWRDIGWDQRAVPSTFVTTYRISEPVLRDSMIYEGGVLGPAADYPRYSRKHKCDAVLILMLGGEVSVAENRYDGGILRRVLTTVRHALVWGNFTVVVDLRLSPGMFGLDPDVDSQDLTQVLREEYESLSTKCTCPECRSPTRCVVGKLKIMSLDEYRETITPEDFELQTVNDTFFDFEPSVKPRATWKMFNPWSLNPKSGSTGMWETYTELR
jgi:hypothetical protein